MPLPMRAHLDGVDDPKLQGRLPALNDVVDDVKRLNATAQNGGVDKNVKISLQGPDGTVTELKNPSEAVRYNIHFPNLFRWSYLVRPEDVPDEVDGVKLVESVIFALKTFHKIMEEESDDTLHLMRHLLDDQYGKKAKRARHLAFLNTCFKAGYHLMQPTIDRQVEAAHYLKISIDVSRKEFSGISKLDHWLLNPAVWAYYGEALCLSENFKEAKVTLEHALVGCEAGSQPSLAAFTLRCHINLSRTLHQLKTDTEVQREHTEWAVTHLRKTPTRFLSKTMLKHILRPCKGTPHPVLESLGGHSWLDKVDGREILSYKEEERSVKVCRHCGIRDVQKALFRCSRCQYMFYCSKACQKADWKTHKEGCTDRYNSIKKLEKLKKEDSVAAQRHADWMEWRDSPAAHRKNAHISALGLHKDPMRGRTHIVLQLVEYTPNTSKDPRSKFTIVATGVFRIKDVLRMIEPSMGLSPGEGPSFIQEVLDEVDRTARPSRDVTSLIPILDLSFGKGVETWLGSNATSHSALRNHPYNQDWRKIINGIGIVPEPLTLVDEVNAKDVEHVFD
ncbi:unnamed protein product [Peniophora sp. CBMAI 1063]|nr:unnamed protein product [Peniophora sp. CBMAI 1063]